jgi:hypothetical protein
VIGATRKLEVSGDAVINGVTVGRGGGNIVLNTANGVNALNANTIGDYNTAIWYQSLLWNNIGGVNTANGFWALRMNITGNSNTANGYSALWQNSSGNSNTAIGRDSWGNLTSWDNNIAIGANTNFPSTTASNQLNIGNWIYGDGGRIAIGTTPHATAMLTVGGTIRITWWSPGAGKVLTSNASGVASWTTPSSNWWGLTGNTGTVAGTNYVGTTDNNDLVFKANNTEKLRITASSWNLVWGGYSNTIGGSNQVAFGDGAGYNMLGSKNTAIWWSNPGSSMSGTQNTGIGWVNAGYSMVWSQNTGIGWSSPGSSMAGTKNTAVGGMNTGYNGYGTENTAVGGVWAWHSMAWTRNTAVWWNAAGYNMLWSNNVAIGTYAGKDMYNINDSIFIGSYAAGNIWQDNQFSLGNVIYGSGMGAAGATNGKVWIGTSTLTSTAKLEIAGTVKITGGAPWAGKVLTSDANGLATWSSVPDELPIGSVIAVNSSSCPAGWAKANGTSGTPDLRGEFIRGLDDGRGVDTARVLASAQSSQNLAHTHGVTDPGHSHVQRANAYDQDWAWSIIAGLNAGGYSAGGPWNGATTNRAVTSISIQSNGWTEARPRNVALLYCVKTSSTPSLSSSVTWANMSGTSTGNVTLATTGNVGIGASTPSQKLEVSGNILATAFLYSSDRRLKQNIVPLKSSLDKVLSLNGYAFDWKSTGSHDIGLIAQEVEKVFPTLVSTNPQTGMKSVQYGNLVAPIIEAIRELASNVQNNTAEIEALRAENAVLKARLDAIEARLVQ